MGKTFRGVFPILGTSNTRRDTGMDTQKAGSFLKELHPDASDYHWRMRYLWEDRICISYLIWMVR